MRAIRVIPCQVRAIFSDGGKLTEDLDLFNLVGDFLLDPTFGFITIFFTTIWENTFGTFSKHLNMQIQGYLMQRCNNMQK